jgi:glycosyltransferase involved in cell wall biosynthesis
VIHGKGPEAEQIAKLIGELDLREKVDVQPFVGGRDLVRTARAATAVVIPSVWEEPGATIAVELFACGVPVIASATGAQGEIFADHGLLAANGAVEAWAESFSRHFSQGPKYPTPTGAEPWTLPVIRRSLLALLDQ